MTRSKPFDSRRANSIAALHALIQKAEAGSLTGPDLDQIAVELERAPIDVSNRAVSALVRIDERIIKQVEINQARAKGYDV